MRVIWHHFLSELILAPWLSILLSTCPETHLLNNLFKKFFLDQRFEFIYNNLRWYIGISSLLGFHSFLKRWFCDCCLGAQWAISMLCPRVWMQVWTKSLWCFTDVHCFRNTERKPEYFHSEKCQCSLRTMWYICDVVLHLLSLPCSNLTDKSPRF